MKLTNVSSLENSLSCYPDHLMFSSCAGAREFATKGVYFASEFSRASPKVMGLEVVEVEDKSTRQYENICAIDGLSYDGSDNDP